MNNQYDVIIIGGGPAGLTAGIYTSRAFLKTLILAGSPPGGQLTTTTDVENYPGFPDGVMGPDLINMFRSQAQRFGCEFVDENVTKVSGEFDATGYGFSVDATNNASYQGKTVIVATGASAKWLNLESEQKLRGKGVSACATCDGFFFKNKVVAVVGAGDSAMEEATFLTKFASEVRVLVRGDQNSMKASKTMQKRALDNPKIKFFYNTQILEVLGENKVVGLKLKNIQNSEESIMNDVEGLFLAIGHQPNTQFLKDTLALDNLGYLTVTNNTNTSIPGIFSAGDVLDRRYRQAITAAGLGCMAALDVEKFLAEHAKA